MTATLVAARNKTRNDEIPSPAAADNKVDPRPNGTLGRMTDEQIDAFGQELDRLREEILAKIGQEDADYIRRIVKVQRGAEVAGRSLFYLGFIPPVWALATGLLGLAKVLDNMEIGHNVIHGQYDFMGDEALNSRVFEWDNVTPAKHWKHSHNYLHHTFTNINGKDRDVGYAILRVSPEQRWEPASILNPAMGLLLASLFQWFVAAHDLETEKLRNRTWKLDDYREKLREVGQKAGRQSLKDFVLFPLATGPLFLSTLAGNVGANFIRDVWSAAIIFCGHFPDDVELFDFTESEKESRGRWYLRQTVGSANIRGGKIFHILSGNLSHQIEHHLFPDLPAYRYAEIAPQVQEICQRYDVPYRSGRFSQQLFSVGKRLCKMALPGGGK